MTDESEQAAREWLSGRFIFIDNEDPNYFLSGTALKEIFVAGQAHGEKHLLAVAEEWLQQEAPGSGGGCNVIHGTPHELCEYLKSYINGNQEA